MNSIRPFLARPAFVFALLIGAAPLPVAGPRPAQAAPETYEIDQSHSYVGFRIRHLVGKVSGQFNKFAGTVVYDVADPAASSVEVTIDPASIDTNDAKRDGHLRSPDFFDVATYPEMRFKSRAVKIDGAKLSVEGDLTMHGVTKQVTLSGEVGGIVQGPDGAKRAGFTVATTINREDFGVQWNKTFDQAHPPKASTTKSYEGGTLLGDDVEVEIAIEAVLKTEETGGAK